jgi:hypothetical protein
MPLRDIARKAGRTLRGGQILDRVLDLALTRSHHADIAFQYYRFIKRHRRFPRKESRLFNDMLFRLRVDGSYYDPAVSFTSCKELSKIYIAGTIGEGYAIPTLAALSSRNELATFAFPARCFIKATHTSGKNIFRERGEPIDLEEIAGWLDYRHYHARRSRSANYRFLKPKVIVEPVVFDGEEVTEYRVFCLGGEPWFIVRNDGNKMTGIRRRIYDARWTDMQCSLGAPLAPVVPRPQVLDEMLRLSRPLARPFALVRLDFYSNGRELRVGEITHGHAGGRQKFIPHEAEAWMTDLLPPSAPPRPSPMGREGVA